MVPSSCWQCIPEPSLIHCYLWSILHLLTLSRTCHSSGCYWFSGEKSLNNNYCMYVHLLPLQCCV
ncbi:hypothetical protein AALO_G00155510 [Alosa alosa]|uniref:Uncharacterized protein n=1 Tax=Alosa alosa TaxID=278164 RepID=A0AAV6GKB5_9TELE|nr:hypothetical protein AALO_G00155510 [Alosa alosa]